MSTTTTASPLLADLTAISAAVGMTLKESDGIVYFLTPCCQASGKGGERGVICRACYRDVSDVYGWGALTTDPNLAADVVAILASRSRS